MRKAALFAAPLLLVACATAPAQTPVDAPVQTPVHGVTPGHTCDTSKTSGFIGKPGTQAVGAAIKDVTNAAVLRWAPPGYMLTMDFREDRVTIWLDTERKITKISCG